MVPPAPPGDRPWKGPGGRAKRRRKHGAIGQRDSCPPGVSEGHGNGRHIFHAGAGPQSLSSRRPHPCSEAHLQGRRTLLPGADALQSSAGHGRRNSLFKHLRGHAPSPKHGIIYRHPAVIGSPRKLRGRVARTLAAKLAMPPAWTITVPVPLWICRHL